MLTEAETDRALVLIVDDDPAIRMLTRESLEQAEFAVAEAQDGTEAIDKFKTLRPDLVLLDLVMPQMDGFATLASLRGLPTGHRVPIVVVSALDDLKSIHRAYEAGATDFVTKPVQWPILSNRVRFVLRASEALERLRDSEATLREAQRLARLANWGWDLNKDVFWWSDEAISMLALEPGDGHFTSEDYLNLVHTDDRDSVEEALRATLEHRRPYELDHRVAMSDQTVRTFHVQGQVTCGRSRKRGSLSGTVQDITDRKRLEEKHQRLQEELHQAQKLEAVGQLAAGIAHEINTPVQFIGDNTRFLRGGFSDLEKLLQRCAELTSAAGGDGACPQLAREIRAELDHADLDFLVEEIPKAIEQSLEGIHRVTQIVRAMKEFSHPGTDDKTLIDLNHAIKTTIIVARNEWKFVADVATDLDPQLPLVPCFSGEINQVILNIIVNAAHAIADAVAGSDFAKGAITIATRQAGNCAEIRITDTGTGIPDGVKAKIFEPFFTTKGVGKGTGQGLSVAHRIVVKRHGGTIAVDTEVGKGTTFLIRLPIEPEVSGHEESARSTPVACSS